MNYMFKKANRNLKSFDQFYKGTQVEKNYRTSGTRARPQCISIGLPLQQIIKIPIYVLRVESWEGTKLELLNVS